MIFDKDKHDIGILRSNGTTQVGLMLARDQYNKPLYRTIVDKYFPSPRYASAPDYGAVDPENELWMIGTDWRSGFGLEVFDASDDKRYYSSIGADLRFKGQAILGSNSTAAIVPTTLNSPTGFVDGAAAWSNEALGYDDAWTTSANTTAQIAAITWSDFLEFTFASTNIVGVGFVAGGENAAVNQIDIDVYYGAAWNHVYQGSLLSQQAGYAKYVSASAVTSLRVRLYNSHASIAYTCNIYGVYFITAGTITTASMANYNSKLYLGCNKILSVLDSGGTYFDPVCIFESNITDIEPFTDNALYIAQGTSDEYWYMNTAETIFKTTLTIKTFQFFKTVHTATPVLWGNDGTNTIRSTVAPYNGGTQWSDQTTIGSSSYSILNLFTKAGALYIKKQDMPYYLTSAGAVQNSLAPELEIAATTTTGQGVFIWQNEIFYPFGTQGLLRIGTSNEYINPAGYCTNLSDFTGKIFGVSGDEEWVFAVQDNSTKIEVLAGRDEYIDGATSWVWHPIHEITCNDVIEVFTSSVTQKRLWIVPASTTGTIYYLPLYLGYGNVTGDTNKTFKTGGYFITPWLHGNFRATTKAFTELTLDMGHTYSANVYWTVAYQILGDTTWTDIGNFDGASGNMIETIAIPADSGGNQPVSTMMRLRFTGVTDVTSTTPILLSYHLKAILYPDVRTIYEIVVEGRDDFMDKNGIPLEGVDAAYVRTVLAEARDATWPFTFYDPWGTSHKVKMMSTEPFSEIIENEENRNIGERFYLRLQETTVHS